MTAATHAIDARTQYEGWVRRMRTDGRRLVSYHCPRCGYELHEVAPDDGDCHTTAVVCPDCDGLHHRRLDGCGLTLFLPL